MHFILKSFYHIFVINTQHQSEKWYIISKVLQNHSTWSTLIFYRHFKHRLVETLYSAHPTFKVSFRWCNLFLKIYQSISLFFLLWFKMILQKWLSVFYISYCLLQWYDIILKCNDIAMFYISLFCEYWTKFIC